MTAIDVVHLIQEHKHDGTYVNYHPQVAEYLIMELERPDSPWTYYIQVIDGYDHIRVWSSKAAHDEKIQLERQSDVACEKAREFYKRYAEPETKVEVPAHPLEVELYALCETAQTAFEFTRVVELKTKLRRLGIKVDDKRTSIRRMAKL